VRISRAERDCLEGRGERQATGMGSPELHERLGFTDEPYHLSAARDEARQQKSRDIRGSAASGGVG
jgi:hypothetical protein